MQILKFIDENKIEYNLNDNEVEYRERIKTKTHYIDSYVINNEVVVTSNFRVVFECEKCGDETECTYSNFKNRKHYMCTSCTRRETAKSVHRKRTQKEKEELNKKISEKTKDAMSIFSEEKKKEIKTKQVEALKNIDWEKRNKKYKETMSLKSEKELTEINKKRSKSLKKTYKDKGPWNLRNIYSGSRHSTIDCKYFTRGVHSSNEEITVICDNCNKEFQTIRMAAARQEREHPGYIQCIDCVNSAKSIKENEIVEYIKGLGIEKIVRNSRKIINPQELDIYLPDYALAIEFNGLYWHSDTKSHKNYHVEKLQKCEKMGIRLINIFQDDWMFKREIVEARLKNILGLNSKSTGARKTVIKEIDSKTKNEFLDKYHIQGSDKSKIKLGAFYNDELIGIMTFAKNRIFSRRKKNEAWELSRFATISDTYTPGLASKLLKHFEKNFEWLEIYSYADRCWSNGDLYYKLKFSLEKETPPSYWYAKNGSSMREHRYNYRKQNLKKFENYDVNKTEKQIMDEAGYLRIYDCGNYKFIKKALN